MQNTPMLFKPKTSKELEPSEVTRLFNVYLEHLDSEDEKEKAKHNFSSYENKLPLMFAGGAGFCDAAAFGYLVAPYIMDALKDQVIGACFAVGGSMLVIMAISLYAGYLVQESLRKNVDRYIEVAQIKENSENNSHNGLSLFNNPTSMPEQHVELASFGLN